MSNRPAEFIVPARLAESVRQQGGVFTAEQAYAAGSNIGEVQRARRSGALVTIRRGIYAIAADYGQLSSDDRYQVRTRALLLALKEPTTLSHWTAALWRGLPVLQPDLDVLHVTRPELRASRLEAGVHHHPGALPDGHWDRWLGAQVTTAARTAVDIARNADFANGLAAADSCLRMGVPSDELQAVLNTCRAWAGSRQASRAVAEADGRAANPGESLSRAVLIEAGLAPTDVQVAIQDRQGLVGYVDFGWLPMKVLGEFDGRAKYGSEASAIADALWREKRREDRLRALGFEIVRWTWADLMSPGRVPAMVRAAMARALVYQVPGA